MVFVSPFLPWFKTSLIQNSYLRPILPNVRVLYLLNPTQNVNTLALYITKKIFYDNTHGQIDIYVHFYEEKCFINIQWKPFEHKVWQFKLCCLKLSKFVLF